MHLGPQVVDAVRMTHDIVRNLIPFAAQADWVAEIVLLANSGGQKRWSIDKSEGLKKSQTVVNQSKRL